MVFFLGTALFTLWAQLTPLGSAPDEASHYVKSAAVVRGEWTGTPIDDWRLAVDGWVHSTDTKVVEVLVASGNEVLARSPLSVVRDDVNLARSLPSDEVVGFDFGVILSERREPIVVAAVLADGTLATVPFIDDTNVKSDPTQASIDGKPLETLSRVVGVVEHADFFGRMEYSYWSTNVDIDKQFDGAHEVQRCFVAQATTPACALSVETWPITEGQALTTMGYYAPSVYLIPGIATLFGASNASWYLARIIGSITAALILALGIASLQSRRLSVFPLLTAAVPAVVYLASVVNPSGLEIIGAVGIWITLPGLLTDSRRDSWALSCFSLSGLVVILARPLGMAYYAVILGICVIGVGNITGLVALARKYLWLSLSHLVALVFATYWYLAVYNSQVDPRMAEHLGPRVPLLEQIAHAMGDVTRVLHEAIGDLGSLEVPLPRLAVLAIVLVTFWIVITGWTTAPISMRRATIALVAIAVVAIVVIDLNYYRILRGYGAQGRHLTPLLVGIPLLAARFARFTRTQRWVIFGVWSTTHLLAGYTALRRYSVGLIGDEVLELFYFPRWSPTLGIVGTLVALSLIVGVIGIVAVRAEGGD